MEIPSSLYGTQKQVSARVREMVKRLSKGEALGEVVGPERLDPASTSGLVLLDKSKLLAGVPSIHAHEPLLELELAVLHKRLPLEIMDRVFHEALATPWGFLCLVAPANQMWLYPKTRHLPFWMKALEYWSALEAVGPRYTSGGADGEPLWSLPNNVHYVAVHLGVPADRLNLKQPLPPGGLAAIDALRARPS